MCGRYKYTPGEFSDLRIRWNLDGDLPLFKPSYNIAPTQQVPVILNTDGANRVELLRWGFVPFWAKDIANGNKMINARAETLTLMERPAFKELLQERRCVVLADGFYEWRKDGKAKIRCCLFSSLVRRSLLRGFEIAGKSRTVRFCKHLRLSPRNPTSCFSRSTTGCR